MRIDTELRAKARDLEINMSRLFEDALQVEVHRRETLAETLSDGVEVHELQLEDEDGVAYVGRITGKHIAADVYLTDDGRVIVYDDAKLKYTIVGDPREDLQLPREEYLAVMDALGLDPTPEVIDL